MLPTTMLLTTMLLVNCSALALGQSAAGQQPVVPRLTRAELLRKWDLNGDGTLDAGEVQVAASKMRLERAEMRLSTGLDPVTGKPRDAASADDGERDAAADEEERKPITVDELAEKLGFTPIDAEGEQDGTARSPGSAGDAAATRPTGAAGGPPRMFGLPPLRIQQPGAFRSPPGAPGTAGSLESGLPLTGGVRAGGLPARPGYGSRVAPPSLNAGRADATTTGGLVPRRRSQPPDAALSTGMQPPVGPPPMAPTRPQRTVDDFDVYR